MDIWNEIVSIVVSNGVFAVLFVLLFFYQLKDSRTREEKYQKTIQTLTAHLNVLDEVQKDVDEIKVCLRIGAQEDDEELEEDL